MSNAETIYDVAVIGGGLAGLTAALAAHKAGLKTALIAKKTATDDGRTTALLAPSIHFLNELDIWPSLQDVSAPLSTMQILDGTQRLLRSRPAAFHSSEIGLEEFGFNIPNQNMLNALYQHINDASIDHIDAHLTDVSFSHDHVTMTLENGKSCRAKYVIAADGRRSIMRQKAGIRHKDWQYNQVAIVLCFSHKLPHQNTSTEFHTETGPFTQVPLPGHRSSLVWVVKKGQEKEILEKPITDLNLMIEQKMHSILGRVEIDTELQSFPLSSLIATQFAKSRVLLVGEAAHAFPPIGAQGFNLGLRDVEDAINVLSDHDLDQPNVIINRFNVKRCGDIVLRTYGVDVLNRSLLSSLLPIQLLRTGGISAIHSFAPLRRFAMKQGTSLR